jgi:hypothetical protein
MKRVLVPALLLAVLTWSGCDSLPGGMGGRMGPPPAQVRIFQADPRVAYDAARVALAQMSFRVTGGGPAQGRIEAVSGLSMSDSLRGSRQISISVRITPLGDGGSEVSAVLKEVIEEDSDRRQGFATETPLRDTPYYEVFFNNLGQALGATKKD